MPFAGYDDFDDCVAKNSKKKDPKGYCAEIQRKAESSDMAENKYTIVMFDDKTLDVIADRYSTTDKDDTIIFYNEDNEPVAEFQRWNIQGLYINL